MLSKKTQDIVNTTQWWGEGNKEQISANAGERAKFSLKTIKKKNL